MKIIALKICFLLAFLVFSINLQAQSVDGPGGTQSDGKIGSNTISTAVPFLLIAPDARSGAMGDVGVAIEPDVNTIHWNPAKLAFLPDKYGFSLSYSPWLQQLVPDINLAYLTGYYKMDSRNTIGGSLRYFSLGNIEAIDEFQNYYGTTNPNELAVDGIFSRTFGENFSLGTGLRFIYSNLSDQVFSGQQTRPGTALAADVSGYFKETAQVFSKETKLALGFNISNIGTKMSYSDGGQKYFLPTNLKIGGASTFKIDDYNDFTFALDFNKLLVPTPPIYDANRRIINGKDPNRSVPAGIFGSFTDAPGGFTEELKEISYSTGMEYWYNKQFAVRAGYFYENPSKGNRQYFTLGAGLRYNIINLDFAYLLANAQKSPLANTLRFSLTFNFGDAPAASQQPLVQPQ